VIAAGQLIGNYRIVQKIGTGGMGAVYLAEHPMIGKKVALKVIHRELASNKEVVQRFFQEARAVNRIGNEHIVEIHDFGVTAEGDHFYIMEYLEGRTLASVLAREPVMDNMRALHVGAQIASALGAAHANGVIHRDLKPDNIMLLTRLGDPDFVKVLDFGLAKMFQGSGASPVQTAAGVLLGTPQYMSPEACESKRDIDHRTDIYALGILLFQMMCGRLPFEGESMGEVLVKQVTQLPPVPRAINPNIPPAVEQVLLRCLAKHPDARFQTMQQLRDALLDPEAYLRASPPIAPARSVAPGEAKVDARTVMAHAAQQKAQGSGQAATMIAAAPPPGSKSRQMQVPGLVAPQEPKHNTMRIATPAGYSSRPPRKAWPIVLVIGLVLGLGGGAFAVAWFGRSHSGETATDADAAVGSTPGSGSGSSVSAVVRDTGSVSSTVAAGGSGSASPPPPIDAAVAIAVAVDATAPPPPVVDASVAAPPARLVRVTLESSPDGATVIGPDGPALGKTPLKLDWPAGEQPVTFVLKLKGYKDKTVEATVTSNSMTRVELDRIQVSRPPGTGNGSGKGSGKRSGDGLIRPDDL
jgi:tRNA A-37 threonylcarbamoyl transferase component Bud32